MQWLKQSTEVKVRIGPFVDVGDGFTPETGITLGAADEAELLKHNGAATVDISGATWAAVTGCDGWYDLTLTTSHTDTLGLLEVVVQDDSVCLPVHARFMVFPSNVWDSFFSTDKLQVDATQIEGSDATDQITSACTSSLNTYDPPTNAELTTAVGAVTLADGAHGGSSASLTLGAGATISNASGSALTLTSSGGNGNGIIATGNGAGSGVRCVAGSTGHGINASASGSAGYAIRAYASGSNGDAIFAYAEGVSAAGMICTGGAQGLYCYSAAGNGIEVIGSTGDIVGDLTGAITGNITGDLSGSVGSVTTKTGYALAADGMDSVTLPAGIITATSIAADAITEAKIADDAIGDEHWNVSGVSVNELAQAALADLFNTDSGTDYASAVAGSAVKEIADNAGGSALTEGGIADAVWDELLSGHTDVGSAGEALAAAGTAGDPWITALPGAYGAGTAGYILGTNLNAPTGTIDTVVDSILEDTGTTIPALIGSPAGASVSADIAAIKAETADIIADTGTDGVVVATASKTGYSLTATTGLGNQTANITGTISGNSTHDAAAVLTELGNGSWATEAGGTGDHLTALPLHADWQDGGRLDLILDGVLEDTGTTLPATLGSPAGANMSADIAAVKAETASILEDTGTTIPATLGSPAGASMSADVAAVKAETASILEDTGTTLEGHVTDIETDTQDIQSRLPAALVSGRMSSDAVSLSGSTTAADNLEASALGIVSGAAAAGTLSTTQMTTNLTEATDDHYIGRIVIWTSGVLAGQATDITDYDGSSKMLTYTAVTEAPSASDTFVIV